MKTIGTGTLLLTNGNIYPVLPQTQPIISTPMLLQVAKNPNTTVIKSATKKTKKDKSSDPKSTIAQKESKKKIYNQKSTNRQVSNISKISPNILPRSFDPLLCPSIITTQVNKSLTPSSSFLKPKILPGINKKRSLGNKIGNKPVGRQALKRIRKTARKQQQEEKEKMINQPQMKEKLPNITDTIKDKSPQKQTSNQDNLKITSCDEEGNVGNSASPKVHETISIISDDILKASDSGVESHPSEIIANRTEQPCQSIDISEKVSFMSNEEKNISQIEVSEKSSSNYVEQNSAVAEESNKIMGLAETHSEMCENSQIPTSVFSKHLDIENDSKNIETNEKTNKSDNKSENNIVLTVSNDEQNTRPESSLDLDNVCSINQQLNIHLGHSELSNDIFASLQVPPGCQNPESTSPTAAFLLAFPLVSSLTGVKVTEVMDEDNPDSQRETPTLLQIGTMDTNKSIQAESFNSNLLNLDFFSSKDIYSGFYNSFEQHLSGLTMLPSNNISESPKVSDKSTTITKIRDDFKSSDVIENIEASGISKQTSSDGHMSLTVNNDLQNNSDFATSNNNCQINFTEKQSDSVSKSEKKNKDHIPLSGAYIQKSSIQCNREEESQKNDCQTVEANKRDILGKSHLPNPIPENIHLKTHFDKDSTSKAKSPPLKSIREKTNNVETCNNIFSVENMDNSLSAHKYQANNMNIFPEKQKSLLSENFSTHNSIIKNNLPPIFRENSQIMPFTTERNYGNSSLQTVDVGNSFNIDNNSTILSKNISNKDASLIEMNQHESSSHKAVIQPYFIQDNKNYQNNTKNINVDTRNIETYKYFNYNNFNSEVKKPIKNNEMSFDFNLDSKAIPIPKISEAKEIIPNYNMSYSNSIYDISNITKVSSSVYNSNKIMSEPLYTNTSNNNYNYYPNSESYIGDTCYKQSKSNKNQGSDLETYGNYKRVDFNNSYYSDNLRKTNTASSKSGNIQEKATYNWMTTPTKSTSEHIIPSFPKDDVIYSNANIIGGNQSVYYNSTSMYSTELNTNLGQTAKKPFDLPLVNMNYQKSDAEEGQNQFTWSPTKMPQFLDPVPTFVSSTLPTLVGDLALGSSNFNDQKYEVTNKCLKHKVAPKINFENQNNFLSVSQLVHHTEKAVPAKPIRRRNSGTGLKNNQMKNKRLGKNNEEQKEVPQCFNRAQGNQNNLKIENKSFNCRQTGHNNFCDKRNNLKVSSTNYSAEALIGHHSQSVNNSKKDQIFSGNSIKNIPVPPYIPENIMPYFPTVDLQQENIQQNQNYQNFPNFTTFSNNTYPTNTFIPSSTITSPYITSSTLVSDISVVNDFGSESMGLFSNSSLSKNKMLSKNNSGHKEDKNNHNHPCTNNATKKVKRKASNDINLTSNLVDFSFLSIPGSTNSPILPDEFHSHSTFLPPPPSQPQLYPCKNTLYPPKQNTITSTAPLLPLPPLPSVTRSGIQHPEVSPSLNAVGTSSLTNFNLSTIFPEINKVGS